MAAAREIPEPLRRHVGTKGEVGSLEVGEELAERTRIHYRTGEIVLADAAGFFEQPDLQFAEAVALLVVLLDQPSELDGAGETGIPGLDCP